MNHRVLVCAVVVLMAGCVRPAAPPTPPKTVHAVAVFPPNNRTGNELLVEGGTLLEKYVFHSERVTVGDVLAGEARRQLESDGMSIIAPDVVDAIVADYQPLTPETAARQAARAHVDAAVLYIEIRRWEPDAPFNPGSIIVSLSATLIDPSDERVLWSAERPSRPIATAGGINLGAADVIAARKAMEELLAPFSAPRPAPPKP